MAKISLEVAEQFQNTNTNNTNQVSFFSLRDNGDEAVVRFMHDSTDDFEILTYHSVSVMTENGSSRDVKVGCARNLNESPDTCPLCAAGNKLNQKIFIRMLQYIPDGQGGVKVQPVVWERSTQYALKLREYINNYGPLSDIICKIIRHGAKGDLQTTYEIVPNLNKNVYPDEVYVKDTSVINSYQACGTIIGDKSADDMRIYLQTGQFPKPQKVNDATAYADPFPGLPGAAEPNYSVAPQPQMTGGYVNPVPTAPAPTQANVAPAMPTVAPQVAPPVQPVAPQQQMPWQQPQGGIQRPIRSY